MGGFPPGLKLSGDGILFPSEAGPAVHYDFPKNRGQPSTNNVDTGQLISSNTGARNQTR